MTGSKYLKLCTAASIAALSVSLAGCGSTDAKQSGNGESNAAGDVTLEFTQWWEPELPDNALRGLMDEFEEQNPGIKVKLLSGPYASTREQIVAGAAAGTMSDVVGLDGAWVNDFAKQGAIANLSEMVEKKGYDASKLVSQVKVDDQTYSIPVTNFVYPLFVNDGLLEKAGIKEAPKTRTDFMKTAQAVSDENTKGWALPLSLEAPNGIQNDVMSWVWASGGSMLKDGKPYLEGNKDVEEVVQYIKDLSDQDLIAPGALTMKEQDKVEEFTNGRVAMMIDSLAHVNLIRENNPDLKFSLAPIPAKDGYDGKRGMPFASWGVGISATSKHPDEAWKLVEFLLSKDVNAKLCDAANAFPGNTDSEPQFVKKDEILASAFEIWKEGTPANEFTGLPVAEQLMREFDESFQKILSEGGDIPSMLKTVQASWTQNF